MRYKILLLSFIIYSCATHREIETDLYFGQSKPDGSMVSEQEWNQFKEEHISKVFKEGSTVLSGAGNWQDPVTHQLITEPTYVVIYFYKRSSSVSRQIDSLRYWYKEKFRQQSVLRVDKKVKAYF